MFVKPARIDPARHPGLYAELPADQRGVATLQVRDPDRHDLIPVEGREVGEGFYWVRRLNDGDVELASADAVAKPAQPRNPKTKG